MTEELTSKEIAIIEKTLQKQKLTELTYKSILNMNPPDKIVKYHEFGKFEYLPITAVSRLLDGLFDGWSSEIKMVNHVINGVYVVIRLTAKIPNSDKVLSADGIGFAEFQTTKGAAPTDFTKLMQGAGVLAVPKAKTEAIKNAAKDFGNLFGRNLSRKDDNFEAEGEVVNASRSKITNTLGVGNETN
jgi:predicted RecA/RadA family phage recombinase